MPEETHSTESKDNDTHTHQSGRPHKKKITLNTGKLLAIGVIVLLCGASFYFGTTYQKNHDKSSSIASRFANTSGRFGGFGGPRGMNGDIGEVTAISSSSITINDRRSDSAKTYSITSSTQISDEGSTVDYTGIKTGDTVLITVDSSSSTTASRIVVSPGSGGPNSAQSNSSGMTESQ